MSEQPPPSRLDVNRDRVRAKLNSLNFVREQRMFGPAEIIAVAGSLLILLLVIVSYLYFLVPANSQIRGTPVGTFTSANAVAYFTGICSKRANH